MTKLALAVALALVAAPAAAEDLYDGRLRR
jgi:hypothetical protein